jgi:hypothetical protein
MKLQELINRNKNVLSRSASKRLSNSIPVSESRERFYSGSLFSLGDIVESEGKSYRVLEKKSNYYQVIDNSGTLIRKFPDSLSLSEADMPGVDIDSLSIYGASVKVDLTEETADILKKILEEVLNTDAVGSIKLINSVNEHYINNTDALEEAFNRLGLPFDRLKESMENSYKPTDKLTVAKIIADTVGVLHDVVSSPDNLVNAAIRKAQKNPALMKNKEVLQSMIKIARDVGIKVSPSAFDEVKESESLDELSINTVNSYMDKAKASRPSNLHKVVKRFAGVERGHDRVHKDEMKKMNDRLTANLKKPVAESK